MALFFLCYRYMFGGAIHTGEVPYVDYLVPGFVATGVLFVGIGAAVATAEDVEQGFVDRLRSLPIPRSSVLAARALADTAILAVASAVTVAIAFAVGFRLHGSVLDWLAAFGPVVVFGFAFEWLFVGMGLLASSPQAAQGMGMIVFPLVFHLERLRHRRLDARLAASVRQVPAADLHGRFGPRADARLSGAGRTRPFTVLLRRPCRDLGGRRCSPFRRRSRSPATGAASASPSGVSDTQVSDT